MYRVIAAGLFFLLFVGVAGAQEAGEAAAGNGRETESEGRTPIAMVLTAEGRRVTLIEGGEVINFDPRSESVAGTPLPAGSALQLDGDTSLELQLLPGKTRILLTAFTAVNIASVGTEGGGEIEMTYGRLRVVYPGASGGEPLTLHGPDARVEVEPGSDVLVDVLAEPDDGTLFTAATNVAGAARIVLQNPEQGRATEVPPGMRLRTATAGEATAISQPAPMRDRAVSFWIERSFVAEPAGPEILESRYLEAFAYVYGFYREEEPEVAQTPSQPPAEEPSAPEPESEEPPEIEPLPTLPELDLAPPEFADGSRELRNGGFGLMAMGVFFATQGLGINYAADSIAGGSVQPEGVRPGTAMIYAGGGFFLGGVGLVIASYF